MCLLWGYLQSWALAAIVATSQQSFKEEEVLLAALSRCRCHDANLPTSGYVYLLMELSVSSY